MNRKVLLVEPNYKNKYPPMGVMKLATYYRMQNDDVRFYKGDMRLLAVELVCEDLMNCLELCFPDIFWKKLYPELFSFVKLGKYDVLNANPIFENQDVLQVVKEYRKKYKDKEYFKNPRFDKVGITTLFTFYWDITINTINFAKQLCKHKKDVMVGGIMSSLLPDEVYEATGIQPFVGLLNHPGDIDDNDIIIDELPLDYSILDEIDYTYPVNNAYFAYMTRGCVNHCRFCAVPKLEPQYRNYISIKKQIEITNARFGERCNLMLLDNNVLASSCYDKIIDEIKECGFGTGATYIEPNQFEITINNLKNSYNDRAYIRKAIKLFLDTVSKLENDAEKTDLYCKLVSCKMYCPCGRKKVVHLNRQNLYNRLKPNNRTVNFACEMAQAR